MLRTSLLLLLLLAAPAWATGEFPPALQTRYSLAAEPICALCHTNGITATGTVNTPFGKALRMQGLVANDVASLNTALDALAAQGVDSDGDGATDVAELMAGTNPNLVDGATDGGTGGGGGGGGTTIPAPRYGCGAAVAPELLLLAALLPLLRRRTRAQRA